MAPLGDQGQRLLVGIGSCVFAPFNESEPLGLQPMLCDSPSKPVAPSMKMPVLDAKSKGRFLPPY